MKDNILFYIYYELCDRYCYSFNVIKYNSLLLVITRKRKRLHDSNESDILSNDIRDIMLFSNKSCQQIYKNNVISRGCKKFYEIIKRHMATHT